MNSLFIAHPPGRTTNESLIRSCGWHRVTDVFPMRMKFHRWTLGFRQFSFDLIAQALQGHSLHVFHCAPLYSVVFQPLHAPVSFFKSRLVVRLGVMCPELRPPRVAILSVRDTAHGFPSSGSPTTFFLEYSRHPLLRLLATCHIRSSIAYLSLGSQV